MNLKTLIRKYLDDLFVKAALLRVSDFDYITEGQRLLNDLNICLVKQETFSDLYTHPFDFFIVHLSETEESCVWKFLAVDMNGPSEEKIRSFKDELFFKNKGQKVNEIPQSAYAREMSDVEWETYDVVISINFSVDESIV